MSNTLDAAQSDLIGRLESDEYFVDIPVVSSRQGDIAQRLARALGPIVGKGGKSGICAIVLQPIASVVDRQVPTPTMRMELTIRIVENVLVNTGGTGTQKSAAAVCRRLVDLLYNYKSEGVYGLLQPKEPHIVPVEDPTGSLAYDVTWATEEAPFGTTVARQVGPVSISVSGSALPYTLTLSTATASASIYYTVDGSYPSAANTTATLYASPFAVTTAKTVRAGAYKTGLIPSDIAAIQIT